MSVLPDASAEGAVPAVRGVLLRRGVQLEVFTIVWVAIEAIGALVAAVQAGSVALLAFGIDSVIEFVAAAVVLRRFRSEQSGEEGSGSDRRALRLIGASFVVLAVYVLVDAVIALLNASHADGSALGLAIAGCALVVMPALAVGKRSTGRLLGSRALIADAAETLACAWLSGTAVIGVGLNAAFGWWWADPAAALVLVPLILNEAREAFEDDED